jgi:hypothetical protein
LREWRFVTDFFRDSELVRDVLNANRSVRAVFEGGQSSHVLKLPSDGSKVFTAFGRIQAAQDLRNIAVSVLGSADVPSAPN